MSRKYCHSCGDKLEQKEEQCWWCETCGQTYFENAAAAVEAVIVNEQNEILVVNRALEPYKGELDFPGGFVDFNETMEEALLRELEEEIGLQKTDFSEPVYVGSYHLPYPWGKDVTQVIVASYVTRLKRPVELLARDDVTNSRFMKFDSSEFKKLLAYRNAGYMIEKIKRAIEA